MFPDLQKEIEERRNASQAPVKNQKGKEYQEEICEIVKTLKLCPPEYYTRLCREILRPFSDCFWHEGCPPPSIKGFKAHIDLKPDAHIKFRQPYRLNKYDETRLMYLYEEAEREGKVQRYQLGEPPPRVCTPVFIVDKKGSLIGRRVGDFTLFNQHTEDYYYPAPDADDALTRATGKKWLNLLDCVGGFEQVDTDESTSELCSTLTPFGTFKSKKTSYGS